ncbi:MAG TPA: Ppx/GppA phosphatase family protein [Caulobacteraceae bacterium]|jgi:exopolyphosphatase/guanosine-5'-triphosphate,3'-diphosphate pyrophosphatase|nr:Ppx/GppA phosphatase family protein [Caulobacteraceae bacterium]
MTPWNAAVIDVGSNSVRLVLYRVEGRAVWTVFNEKILAGLGRDLAVTGRLSRDGVEAALAALRRFAVLVAAAGPTRVFAVATAAAREAEDGPAFCRRVRAETGLDLRVLTGEQEARYAALGVLAGAPDSVGLAGDLGGASLELIRIERPDEGVTLPLGPFSFKERFDADRVRSQVERKLKPHADRLKTPVFHAVGGAWRNLALLAMRMSAYPLEIVHQYEMTRREALEAARVIARQSPRSLERIEGVSKRRLETLPHAAAVLEGLIDMLGIERIVLSAYGLREGVLFEAMSPAEQAQDPLIEGCAALSAREGANPALGAAVEAWVAPAFAELEPTIGARETTLVRAACRLADLGARLHPDHRADLIFHQVLRAPIPGMNHSERVFLAAALFGRHTAAATVPEPDLTARLLTHEGVLRARAVGAAIRLACDLSGRSPELLARSCLDIRPSSVVLEAEAASAPILLGEQTAKRAAALAALLERELKLRPAPSRERLKHEPVA